MKFLILSDMHGDFEKLDRLDEKFREADAVIFGGDFQNSKALKPVFLQWKLSAKNMT